MSNNLLPRQIDLWHSISSLPLSTVDECMEEITQRTTLNAIDGVKLVGRLYCPYDVEFLVGGNAQTLGSYGRMLVDSKVADESVSPLCNPGTPMHTKVMQKGYATPSTPTRLVSDLVIIFYFLASTSFRGTSKTPSAIRQYLSDRLNLKPMKREVKREMKTTKDAYAPKEEDINKLLDGIDAKAPIDKDVDIEFIRTTLNEVAVTQACGASMSGVYLLADIIETGRKNYAALRWFGFDEPTAKALVRKDIQTRI